MGRDQGKLGVFFCDILTHWEIYPVLLVFGIWYSFMLDGSFWNDEVIYVTSASNILEGNIFVNLEHPPLGKYMIALGMLLFGENEFGARFPAVLFGLGTLYLTYRIGEKMGSRNGGLLAAVLVGVTFSFAKYAVQGMLDIYLAFFTTLLFFLLLLFDEAWKRGAKERAKKRWYLVIGITAGLAFLTKFYSIIFITVIIVVLLSRARKDEEGTKAGQSGPRFSGRSKGYTEKKSIREYLIPRPYAKWMWAGLIGVVLVNYIPYLIRPDLLLYYIIGWNSAHLAAGHGVMVGDISYTYPPLWSYVYWTYDAAFSYFAALVIGGISLFMGLRAKELTSSERLLFFYTFIPFTVLSILTVKSVRYMISIFPLMAIVLFLVLPRTISRALEWLDIDANVLKSPRSVRRAAIGCLLVILFIPPSPLYDVFRDPDFGIDSHYDEASDIVADFAEDYSNVTVEVVSFYCQSLDYYLERDHSEIENIHSVNLYYNSSGLQERFENDDVHLVIAKTRNPRFEDTDIYQVIHGKNVKKTEIGGDLSAYIMKYPY